MADRTVHYEAAFEELLRQRHLPYVAVDEARRALFAGTSLKSFDFVVYSPSGPNLLVDVKGRCCRDREHVRGFDSWATEQDVDDLIAWQRVFGHGFISLFAFLYWIESPMLPEPGMFEHRDRWYFGLGVPVTDYRDHMRRRSPRWGTVCLAAGDFRRLATPLDRWLSSGNEGKCSQVVAGNAGAAGRLCVSGPGDGPG
ncbi:MAG: HYExAFE family protein [Tepidisphaerales bacterium]